MSRHHHDTSFIDRLGASVKSLVKIALQSRPVKRVAAERQGNLIVMGNGPSLNDAMTKHARSLHANDLMAVNFAANAPQFLDFKPDYYVMADPVFFNDLTNANVKKLWHNLASAVDWPLQLFIPVKAKLPAPLPANIKVERFNPVGVEGFGWIERLAFGLRLGMPRPRNVLIPAIMTGLALGYKSIYIAGADHSWSKTLEVTDENVVVSVQPHFYEDNDAERERVATVYRDIRLHQIMYSFYVAFRSYFALRRFAERIGAAIYNSTPGSFIDAFERRPLP